MNLIDTHCHLNFNAFKGDFLEVAKKAREVGIEKIIIPGSNIENSISAVKMAEKLNENEKKMSVTLPADLGRDYTYNDIQELKNLLVRIKNIEEQAIELISRLGKQ